jgi:hypothetical protein
MRRRRRRVIYSRRENRDHEALGRRKVCDVKRLNESALGSCEGGREGVRRR